MQTEIHRQLGNYTQGTFKKTNKQTIKFDWNILNIDAI